ncbi:HpcH/HpaI aldolase/citrate lyase family protein, partial [Streptomyces stelliscabiei]
MTPIPLTWLYVPGDRPEVVTKALASGADVVIVDLEDAVAPDRKAYARAATADLLSAPPPVPVHVRVNALHTPDAEQDLKALSLLPGLSALRLPKVTSPAEVAAVAEGTAHAEGGAIPLYALLESALGVERAYDIATAHPALRGIALGEADLRADLAVHHDRALDWPRSRVVLAARAA